MYLSETGAVSDKYPTAFTPAGWTFSIWTFIYAWQLLHSAYSLSLICRQTSNGQYLYVNPGHIHFSFYIVYLLNNGFNIGWIFLFDREFLEASFVFICLITVTLYICGVIICRYLDQSGSYLVSTGGMKEIWLTRVFTLNGIAFYGTWVTLASLLNFAIVLEHRAGVESITCAWVALGIVAAELLTWFTLETFVFDRYLRYCFGPYIVLPIALGGILSKNLDPASPAPHLILVMVLLGLSLLLGLVKLIVMLVKGRRNPIIYDNISHPSVTTELASYQVTTKA